MNTSSLENKFMEFSLGINLDKNRLLFSNFFILIKKRLRTILVKQEYTISELDYRRINKEILELAKQLIEISYFIDKYFSLEDKVQLISGNLKHCLNIAKGISQNISVIELILNQGEFYYRKGCKNILNVLPSEVPLYTALNRYCINN